MAGEASKVNGLKGGRPKGSGERIRLALAAHTYIAKRVKKEQKPIVDKAIEQAKGGDAKAREWLSDRAWGKIPQPIAGDGENPIVIKGVEIKFRE